jgi:hypothetical protein
MVQVHPGPPSARHSSVTGPGRRAAAAGSKAEFSVVLRDALGNACATPSSRSSSNGSGSNGSSSSSNGSSSGGIGGKQTVKQEPCLLEVSQSADCS